MFLNSEGARQLFIKNPRRGLLGNLDIPGATVSKVGEGQLFYLMSRGLSEEEAMAMVVNGFIEPIAKELPLEYAIELNRLIQLEMEGSVG